MQLPNGVSLRWVWSELETLPSGQEFPVCRDYALQWVAPLHFGTHALVKCYMTVNQIQALQEDTRLILLPSLYSNAPVVTDVTTALASYGVTSSMTLHDVLAQLALTDPQFLPTE